MAHRTLVATHAPVDAQLVLDQARAGLLVRLHHRSDDFAATNELQEVNARSAQLKSHTDSSDSDRLVHAGLSSNERTRAWLRSKTRRRARRAEASARARGPGQEASGRLR